MQQTFTLDDTPPPFPPLGPFNPAATEVESINLELEDEPLTRTMAATYSADLIQNEKRLRGIIEYNGSLWVCTGTGGNGVNLNEILPGVIPNVPKTVKFSYSGIVVMYRGLSYTLTYRKVYIKYKAPATTPAILHVDDKAGMKHIAERMTRVPPDKQDHPYTLQLLGRVWMMASVELSPLQAKFLLLEVQFHSPRSAGDLRFPQAPEIPPERMQDHPWVGITRPAGVSAVLTILPTQMTVICPASFHQVYKAWIKEYNDLGPNSGDDEEEAPAAQPAAAPAAPAPKRSTKTVYVQQTFTL